MFEAANHLREEFAELETALGDPAVHADLGQARRIGRRYAELTPIVRALDEYQRVATTDMAYIFYQDPVMVAVHGRHMLKNLNPVS